MTASATHHHGSWRYYRSPPRGPMAELLHQGPTAASRVDRLRYRWWVDVRGTGELRPFLALHVNHGKGK